MIFEELTEFKRDLKKLLKKYRTLNSDLDVVKKVLGAGVYVLRLFINSIGVITGI